MQPRDVNKTHRAATPLELLFDLATVIAIASAADGLHHALVAGHISEGIIKFAVAFFGIWWAWMNYTWFTSAYDNNDKPTIQLTGCSFEVYLDCYAFCQLNDKKSPISTK